MRGERERRDEGGRGEGEKEGVKRESERWLHYSHYKHTHHT